MSKRDAGEARLDELLAGTDSDDDSDYTAGSRTDSDVSDGNSCLLRGEL